MKINFKDTQHRTPIFYAVYLDNYELTDIFLTNGAEVLYRDNNFRTVLHIACIKGVDKKLVELLID